MIKKKKMKSKMTRKKPSKFTHSVSTLKKLEAARARLGERSGMGGRSSSIEAWIRSDVAGKAAVEQWLDACLDGNSDWSSKRVLQDLVEHFDYPFSVKSSGGFAQHLRAIYGERYDLAIEMAAKTRSERP
jgi:hypothetical protein